MAMPNPMGLVSICIYIEDDLEGHYASVNERTPVEVKLSVTWNVHCQSLWR